MTRNWRSLALRQSLAFQSSRETTGEHPTRRNKSSAGATHRDDQRRLTKGGHRRQIIKSINMREGSCCPIRRPPVVGPRKRSSLPRRIAANSDTLILIGKLKKRNDAGGKNSKIAAAATLYVIDK